MREKIFIFILLLCAVTVAYFPSLCGSFVWDDRILIKDNFFASGAGSLSGIFSSELHPNTGTNYYRPMTALTFFLDYKAFGFHSVAYHATNIIFHFIAGFLLFLLLKRFTKSNLLSLVTSVFFLVHPVHSEAVGYIAGRADSLAALFVFLALWSYCLAQSKRRWYIVFYFSFLAALLSRESSLILPFVVLGLDILIAPGKNRIARVGPVFIAALFFMILRLSFFDFSGGDPWFVKKGFAILEIGFFQRFILFLKTCVLYVGNLFFPWDLHMEKILEFERIDLFHWLGFFVFLFFCFLVRREKRLLFFSLLWFVAWLLPQSAFVFPKIMADHFLYLPSIGVFFIMAMALERLKVFRLRVLLFFLSTLYFLLSTFSHNYQWQDELIFFQRLVKAAPMSIRAHEKLAETYQFRGEIRRAIEEYRMILPIVLKNPESMAKVFYNIGVLSVSQGEYREAENAYRLSLKMNPYVAAVYNNLGVLREKNGDMGEAQAYYRKAIFLEPRDVAAYNNLAILYANNKEEEKALDLWREALKIHPDYDLAKKNIGLLQEAMKKH